MARLLGLVGALMVAIVPGCSCETYCDALGCAPQSEIRFVEPVLDVEGISIEIIPEPEGRVFTCDGSDGCGFIRESEDGGPSWLVGARVPTQFEEASVVIRLDGMDVYRGRAELVRNFDPPSACGRVECRVPILEAR